VRGSERVRHVLSQIPRAPEVERQRQRVLVSLALGGIEVVAGEPYVTPAVPRVDRQAGEREPGILGDGDPAVPFPAGGRLDPERAALSISSNIVEACGRGTVPEFRQFLMYARGSAREMATQLHVAAILDPAQQRAIHALEARVILIAKMLARLHASPPPDR